jgi:hypothetical protein
MAVPSTRLVVDASVASAAGQTLYPSSFRSREFLAEVLKISHRIVMTAALAEEWDKHQSLFALRWRAQMRSQAKIIDFVDVENVDVRSEVTMSLGVMKDLHLVEAALATDKLVVSLDDRAVADGGHAIYWLRAGANPVERWKLGYNA